MDNQKIKVSVYCLAYNHEKYIKDALEGFVNQRTNFKYEVYVHDDASNDATADIIRDYEKRFPDIIKPIYQTENQYSKGVWISGTYIFPHFQGEYVAICEGDDYWCDINKLQMQVDFLDSHNEYIACAHNSRVVNMLSGSEELRNDRKFEYDVTVDEVLNRIVEGLKQPWQFSGLMYRKKVLDDVTPEFVNKLKSASDITTDLRLLCAGKVRFFPQVMSVYRMETDTSIARRASSRNKSFQNEMIDMLIEFDKYTEYQYTNVVQRNIGQRKSFIYIEKGDLLNLLIDKDVKKYFKHLSYLARIATYKKCLVNKLSDVIT